MMLDRISLVVDLIECHPVSDLVLVALEADCRVLDKEVDRLSVQEAVILFYQCPGQFKMAQRDERFDIVFSQFVKQVIIELQSFLVRFILIASGEDPGPGNRCTEALEAHFRKQSDVFLVMMIEVCRFMVRIVFTFQNTVRDPSGDAGASDSHDISDTDALSADIPRAFRLMGSCRTAPQKVFSHMMNDLLLYISVYSLPCQSDKYQTKYAHSLKLVHIKFRQETHEVRHHSLLYAYGTGMSGDLPPTVYRSRASGFLHSGI